MTSTQQDFAVREISASRPRLRPDLTCSIQEFRGERCCVIEDPGSGKFHRIGLREYAFIRLLDGDRTVEDAQSSMARSTGDDALTESEVTSILRWLLENGLAVTDESTRADLMFQRLEKQRSQQLQNWTNILFFRQRLGNPDRILGRIERVFGWMAGPWGTVLWATLMVTAGIFLALNWDTFLSDAGGVLATENWLWLLLAWFLLKVIHEVGHGLVCKHYGGQVPEAGLLFVLFAPLGYVDATSSWRFPQKWKRIHVSAAGMWIELGVAAIAVLVWSYTETGAVQTIAYNVILMATTVTFLFNANPLLKFDGYYILADLVEIPNLYGKGQESLFAAARRYLVGIEAVPAPDWKDPEAVFILVYGAAALIWRIVVLTVIIIAASFLFGGGGLILGLISLAIMAGRALKNLAAYFRDGRPGERPDPKIYGPRLALLAGAAGLVLFFPFRPTLTAPGVTDFGNAAIVRVECPGFVKEVHSAQEARVRKSDPILTLTNAEEEARLLRLKNRLRQAGIRARRHQTAGDLSTAQMETQKLESLRKQVREQEAYVGSLVLRAPSDGRLIGRQLSNLPGTYLQTGTEVGTIQQRKLREVEVAIPQTDIELYRQHQDHPVQVKILGRPGRFYGLLQAPDPQASRQVPHPALAGSLGGPLPVVAKEMPPDSHSGSPRQQDSYELVRPVFTAKVSIKERLDENLRSGEAAFVKFRSRQSRPFWKRVAQGVGQVVQHLSWTAEQRAAER